MTNKNITFGDYIRKKRLDLNLSLREFCTRYDVDAAYLSRVERGILKPSIDNDKLKKLALSLKIEHDSKDWFEFVDLAYLANKTIPDSVANRPDVVGFLPAFFRAVDGQKLTKEKIDELIKVIDGK